MPIVILSLGCGDPLERELRQGTPHPVADYRVPADPPAVQVDAPFPGSSADSSAASSGEPFRIRHRQLLQIGVLTGPHSKVFGKIAGAAIDTADRLLVLDERYAELRVYDLSGASKQLLGQSGEGPGEFQRPVALFYDRTQGSVYVADDVLFRVSVFSPDDAGAYTLQRTLSIPEIAPRDLCVHGHHLLVAGPRNRGASGTLDREATLNAGNAIHEYTTEGRFVRSFGTFYSPPSAMIRRDFANGVVACHAGSPVVVAAVWWLPEVRGYALDGSLLWRSVLSRFDPILYVETRRGSVIQGLPLDGSPVQRVLRAVSAPSGTVLLQVATSSMSSAEAKREYEALDTYRFEMASGKGEFTGGQLGMVHYVDHKYLVTSRPEPYPHLRVHEIESWPGSVGGDNETVTNRQDVGGSGMR